MATNFEFYKDEILEVLDDCWGFGIENGKISKCGTTNCNRCDFSKEVSNVACNKARFEWLYAEHVDQPKLTKRERAFCEAVQTGWIARDENELLWLFGDSSNIVKDDCEWISDSYFYQIKGELFNFIKWEDEKPWAVKDLLKLDVIEVQEDA